MFSKKPKSSKPDAKSWMKRNKKLLTSEMGLSEEVLGFLEPRRANDRNTHLMTEMRAVTILSTKRKNLVRKTIQDLQSITIQQCYSVKDLLLGRIQMKTRRGYFGHLLRQISHNPCHIHLTQGESNNMIETIRIVIKNNNRKFKEILISILSHLRISLVHNYNSNRSSLICYKPPNLQISTRHRSNS